MGDIIPSGQSDGLRVTKQGGLLSERPIFPFPVFCPCHPKILPSRPLKKQTANKIKKMRKFLFLAIIMIAALGVKAQNVQLHYDFGSALYDKELDGRPVVTTTVEMFKPDKWGSTYFFIDMDYTSDGVAAGYWEIARELRFWQPSFSIHVEYNGGASNKFSYNNAYLGGLTYTWNSPDFTKGFSLTAMYKYIQKHKSPNNFQLTGTWFLHFGKDGLCTFSGFADWWREQTFYEDGSHHNFIFLSEPQFWLNLNKFKKIDDRFKLSVGTEVELSQNFGARNGFYAIPTLAIKWSFD